jgi:uncharacterized protein (DUF58 family)
MIDFFDDIKIFSTKFFVLLGTFLFLLIGVYFTWIHLVPAFRVLAVVFIIFTVYFIFSTIFKQVYLTNRFFLMMGIVITLFVVSFVWDFLFSLAQTGLIMLAAIFVVDIALLFGLGVHIKCKRKTPKRMSLGDENTIEIFLESFYRLPLSCELVDEIPVQFQKRDFAIYFTLKKLEEKVVTYTLRPVTRGEYHFHKLNLFINNPIGLVQRRIPYDLEQMVPVFPSLIQMKKFELQSFQSLSNFKGIKKMRRIGHSYEFEQIKNYVRGDDYRSINWKATSRRNQLMVNQYEDEKAQQVYSIIDKSRSMKMPFNGMSLLDYAINTSLVISNVSLQKQDRAGLLTFSDKIGSMVKAERKMNQLTEILQMLYREKERDFEANYELLYSSSRRFIQGRSLIFLYTNFESSYAMERVLPILRRISNRHLLVVVFFENTEMLAYTDKEVDTTQDIYFQTIARQFLSEKQQIVQTLRQYGIQSILTSPDELSMNTVNKYLELKSRGLI